MGNFADAYRALRDETMPNVDEFTRAYIECALWSSVDHHGDPLDDSFDATDLAPETLQAMIDDCADFRAHHGAELDRAGDDAQNGHDFWLTRNGHGAGFWDRGYGEVGRVLSDAARVYGSVDLYPGDDDQIYC